jgi:hypothetical protein
MDDVSGPIVGVRGLPARSALQRVVPYTWTRHLLLICGVMLASFLIAGFWFPYWRVADMDFFVVYNAFLLNTPLPQEFFDHPAYLSILSLSYWLKALHGLGLLHVYTFPGVPPLSDAAGFADAWTQATRAGRVLSFLFAIGFVLSFAYLLRALVRDWRVAIHGGFMLAFSGGMAMQMRIMRSELLCAALFTSAVLLLMIVAARGPRWWRPVMVGIGAVLVTLAIENKVQMFLLACALPVLLIFVGPAAKPARGMWDDARKAWPLLIVTAAVALIAGYLARDLIAVGFSQTSAPGLFFTAKSVVTYIYWALAVAWFALGMIAYAVHWRVAPLEAATAMLAAVAGCMIGLLALDVSYNVNNVVAVFHPLEQMAVFAGWARAQLRTGSFVDAEHLAFLPAAIAGVAARVTFFLHPSTRPAIFLQWFVIAATIIAIRRRNWRLVLPVAALMLTVWGIDALDMGRGLKQEYFTLTDPLVIIAAALLIAGLADLPYHRWAYPIALALIVVHIVMSQAEPVKKLIKSDGPDVICNFYYYAARVEHFPSCPRMQ